MWDGLAQLIQIVIVLALNLVGIEYRAPEEPQDEPKEAAVERLIRPASLSFGSSPAYAEGRCVVENGVEPGVPLLITVKANDIAA